MPLLNLFLSPLRNGLAGTLPRWLWLPLLACSLAACAAGGSTASPSLRGTAWMWVPLTGDLPAPVAAGGRVPQFVLDPGTQRLTGHTGCNRLMSSFELDGSALRFTQGATTRMACIEGGDVEQQFLTALNAVRGWRIEGRVLLLTGADGAPVMRLQAAQ